MFNLDDSQRRVIRLTIGSAFGFWVCSQIADSHLVERLCNQFTILALAAGALRVWVLEAVKPSHS